MLVVFRRFIAIAAFVPIVTVGAADAKTLYSAPANEVLLLPRFCWGQYMAGVDGPEFEIRDCGVAWNHYCPGLIQLNEARKPNVTRGAKIQLLQRAKTNTLYTLRGIEPYPACKIRTHAQTTLQQINTLLNAYSR
jgi:hypothetical protein